MGLQQGGEGWQGASRKGHNSLYGAGEAAPVFVSSELTVKCVTVCHCFVGWTWFGGDMEDRPSRISGLHDMEISSLPQGMDVSN